MSSGNLYDDTPSPRALEDWRAITRAHPKVLRLQQKYLDLRNVHSYDMPYLAGYSTKRDRIFFDRHLEYIQTIGGRRLNVNLCIKLHEATESALLDCWNLFSGQLRLPTKPQYEFAHHIATAVEYQSVEALDVKVADYKKCLRPQIKADLHEKLEKVPRDFDIFPLENDTSPEGKKLLARVLVAMARDSGSRLGFRRKRSKISVDYSKGHPPNGDFCGICRYYEGAAHSDGPCRRVEGTVDWDYWCELFDRKTGAH